MSLSKRTVIQIEAISSKPLLIPHCLQTRRVWDIRKAPSHKPTPVEEPLPTDCRFRQDLIALKNKDYEGAQM